MDFIVRRANGRMDVVEREVNPDRLDTSAIEVFRGLYPEGDNHVVGPTATAPYRIRRGGTVMTVCTTKELA